MKQKRVKCYLEYNIIQKKERYIVSTLDDDMISITVDLEGISMNQIKYIPRRNQLMET